MSTTTQLLVFRLADQRYALPLDAVERVVRAAAVTPLPEAPDCVRGLLQVGDRVLPVLSMRQRLALPDHDIHPDEHFLIAHTSKRTVVLIIDDAIGVIDHLPEDIVEPSLIFAGLGRLSGVIRRDDGLILIHDIDAFLSNEESLALDHLMEREATHAS